MFPGYSLGLLLGWVAATTILPLSGHAEESTTTYPETPGLIDTNSLADLTPDQLVNVKIASVYSASKHEQKVSQAPAAVSIITSEDIQRFGHRTLAEALRSVRGFYVANDRNYSYLGMRGFSRPGDYNTRVLLMVDGHRLNDNVYDGAFIGTEAFLDIDLVDRVEIIRGPSSSIYGNSAFLGVINILTRKGKDLDGWEVSAAGGSFDTYQGRLSYGSSLDNGLDFLVSGSWYESDGQEKLFYREFNTPENNNGIVRNSDGDTSRTFFSKLTWGDFSLRGGYAWREKEIPTASFDSIFNDGHEETIDVRGFAELKYERDLGRETRLLARTYYDRYEYYGTYPFNYAAPGDPIERVINKDDTIGDWIGTEFQVTKTIEAHTLIVGGEYRENVRQLQHNYDRSPRFDYVDVNNSSRNFGLYAQAEVALRTNLLFNAGVRYDYYETFGSTLNPRAGLIYNPWEPATFKLLYGRAFRAPSDFELYYYSSDFSGSLDLDPETIDTYELVHEQQLSSIYRLSSSLYWYEIQNLISQQEDTVNETLLFANVDHVRASGLELELDGRYESGLRAQASYVLQRTRDAKAGVDLSNSPRHLGKLNFVVPVYREKIFAGLELQYNGKVRTFYGGTAGDSWIANLTLSSRELVKGLDASVSIYNLFNTGYGNPGAGDHVQEILRQDGRSFRLKLTFRF